MFNIRLTGIYLSIFGKYIDKVAYRNLGGFDNAIDRKMHALHVFLRSSAKEHTAFYPEEHRYIFSCIELAALKNGKKVSISSKDRYKVVYKFDPSVALYKKYLSNKYNNHKDYKYKLLKPNRNKIFTEKEFKEHIKKKKKHVVTYVAQCRKNIVIPMKLQVLLNMFINQHLKKYSQPVFIAQMLKEDIEEESQEEETKAQDPEDQKLPTIPEENVVIDEIPVVPTIINDTYTPDNIPFIKQPVYLTGSGASKSFSSFDSEGTEFSLSPKRENEKLLTKDSSDEDFETFKKQTGAIYEKANTLTKEELLILYSHDSLGRDECMALYDTFNGRVPLHILKNNHHSIIFYAYDDYWDMYIPFTHDPIYQRYLRLYMQGELRDIPSSVSFIFRRINKYLVRYHKDEEFTEDYALGILFTFGIPVEHTNKIIELVGKVSSTSRFLLDHRGFGIYCVEYFSIKVDQNAKLSHISGKGAIWGSIYDFQDRYYHISEMPNMVKFRNIKNKFRWFYSHDFTNPNIDNVLQNLYGYGVKLKYPYPKKWIFNYFTILGSLYLVIINGNIILLGVFCRYFLFAVTEEVIKHISPYSALFLPFFESWDIKSLLYKILAHYSIMQIEDLRMKILIHLMINLFCYYFCPWFTLCIFDERTRSKTQKKNDKLEKRHKRTRACVKKHRQIAYDIKYNIFNAQCKQELVLDYITKEDVDISHKQFTAQALSVEQAIFSTIDMSLIARYIVPNIVNNYKGGNYNGLLLDLLYSVYVIYKDKIKDDLRTWQNNIKNDIAKRTAFQVVECLRTSVVSSSVFQQGAEFVHTLHMNTNEVVKITTDSVMYFLRPVWSPIEPVDFQAQSIEDIFKYISDTLKMKFELARNSVFVYKISQAVSLGFIIPLLEFMSLSDYIPQAISFVKNVSGLSTLSGFIDLVVEFFTSFLPGLYKNDMEFSRTALESWTSRAVLHNKFAASITALNEYGITPDNRDKALPAAVRVTEYITVCHRLIGEGSKLARCVSKESPYHHIIGRIVADLEFSLLTANRISTTFKLKMAPFVIHAFGPPGLGKSSNLAPLLPALGEIFGFDPHDVWKWANSKFMDGYMGQFVIFIDDFNQVKNPEIMALICQLFVEITGNESTIANCSQVEDKGKMLANPKVLYVTTNASHAYTEGVFNSPEAAMRRLKHAIRYYIDEAVDAQGNRGTCVFYECFVRDIKALGKVVHLSPENKLVTNDYAKVVEWIKERALEHKAEQTAHLERVVDISAGSRIRWLNVHHAGGFTNWYMPVPSYIANPILSYFECYRESVEPFYTKTVGVFVSPLIEHGFSRLLQIMLTLICPLWSYWIHIWYFSALALFQTNWYNNYRLVDNMAEFVIRCGTLIAMDGISFGWLIHIMYNSVILYINADTIVKSEYTAERIMVFEGYKTSYLPYFIALGGFITLIYSAFKSTAFNSHKYGDEVPQEDLDHMIRINNKLGITEASTVPRHPTSRQLTVVQPILIPTGTQGRLEKIKRCVVELKIYPDNSTKVISGIGSIFGNAILTSTHVIPSCEHFHIKFMYNGIGKEYKIKYSTLLLENDICTIILSEVLSNSLDFSYINVSKLLSHESCKFYHVYKEISEIDVTPCAEKEINISYGEIDEYGKPILSKLKIDYTGYPNPSNLPKCGYSGMPIVLYHKSTVFICGIHSAMAQAPDTMVIGNLITSKYIDLLRTVRSLKEGGNIVTQYDLATYDGKNPIAVKPLHENSILNYFNGQNNRSVTPLGTVSYKGKPNPSRIVLSDFYYHVWDKVVDYDIPKFDNVIKKTAQGETWISPMLVNMSEVGNRIRITNVPVLRAIQQYIADRLVQKAKFPMDGPLTIQQAVNGIPGIMTSLELNASGGPGFNGTKANYVNGIHPNLVPNNKVLIAVENMIDELKRGNSPTFVFQASLKDEVIKKSKLEDGRIRLFCGSSLPMVIIFRMIFGNVFAWMQNNRMCHPWKIGVNATSTEWHIIAERLKKFNRIHEGDIKFFDKMNSIMQIAVEILVECMRQYGIGGWVLDCARSLTVACYSYILDIEGSLAHLESAAPSGVPGTTYFNCVCENFAEVYAYLFSWVDYEQSCEKFAENVQDFGIMSVPTFNRLIHEHDYYDNNELMNYGDDNIKGIEDSVGYFYTDERIYEGFKDLSFILTRADKTEGFPVSKTSLDTCSFLKRGFYFNVDIQQYTAPLEEVSIWKMLAFFEDKQKITRKEFNKVVLNEAQRQFWLHGPDKFEKFIKFVHSLPPDLIKDVKIYNYDELKEEYLQASIRPFVTWSI